jgi:type IX secretion system PorP/SprF family membrane protein
MKKFLLLIFTVSFSGIVSGQQLPLYSQYSWNDYVINPAFTGSYNYSPIQISYRKQWAGFNGSPELFTLGGHTRVSDKIALGGLIFKDNTGGAITQTGVLINYCYRIRLNDRSKLSMALSGNFYQYTFDNNKVKALTPGDPSIQDGVQKSVSPDASFGLLYQNEQEFKFGFSVNQLFESRLSNVNNTTQNNLVRHFNFNISKSFRVDSIFALEPALLVKTTNASPVQSDLMLRLRYKDILWIGASYRHEDAIVGMFGFQANNLFISYSYDATTSELANYSSGSHEIVLGLRLGSKTLKTWIADIDKDGTPDSLDRCPTVAGLTENFGCPWMDKDKDGISDNEDRCPDLFGDIKNKGCPLADKDGDLIPDDQDNCPNTKGEVSNSGCPVVTEKQKEVVSKAITNLEFESNKATIKKESFLGLDMLAILLSEKPDWKLKLAGHTDDVGSDEFNMQLSKDRANSVKQYLVSKGVSSDRLVVEYFGKSKPITSNSSEEGRKQNRRVEMSFVFE